MTKTNKNHSIPILIIDNSFTFGGAINSLEYLLKAIDKKTFHPVIVSGQPKNYMEAHFPDCTIKHFMPRLTWVDNKYYRRLSRLPLFQYRWLRKILNLSRYLYWIMFVHIPEALVYYRAGRKEGVELVHLNNILSSQFSAILAARFIGVSCVAHLRDFEEVHPITRFYSRLIDHHVAISAAIRDNLLQLGVPKEEITLVHDGIELNKFDAEIENAYLYEEFSVAQDCPRYGIFGRIVDWKGIKEFIHAASYVIKNEPDAIAFIVGNCSDGDHGFMLEMVQLVEELGLSKHVLFTGYRHDVPSLMSFMDIVVHASKSPEPFGMVLIEAMAMGKPVVATRGGGPLDVVIDGETGFLVEMGNAAALSEAICYFLAHPELQQKMGQAGWKRVNEQFSSTKYAQKMETIYMKQLMSRQR